MTLDAAHAIQGKPVLDIPRLKDDNRPKESLRIAFVDTANPDEVVRPSCLIGTARGKLPDVCQVLVTKIASTDLP